MKGEGWKTKKKEKEGRKWKEKRKEIFLYLPVKASSYSVVGSIAATPPHWTCCIFNWNSSSACEELNPKKSNKTEKQKSQKRQQGEKCIETENKEKGWKKEIRTEKKREIKKRRKEIFFASLHFCSYLLFVFFRTWKGATMNKPRGRILGIFLRIWKIFFFL